MENLQAIKEYQQQISWANETLIVEIKVKPAKTVMLSKLAIYFPTHYSDFDSIKDNQQLWGFAKLLGLRPALIIYGDPDKAVTERIWREAMQVTDFIGRDLVPLHTVFIDLVAKVYVARLITQHLDGLDWNQTFSNIAESGIQAKPAWQWEMDQ